MNAIEFIDVSKKFKKGERFDSLRDFIPSLVKYAFGKNNKNGGLKEQEFWAVKNASFQLKKGEALGIIGSNGAGKSTILKMLSRIYKPTSGEIKINGKLSALLEVGAGFHPDLTGRENIRLSGTIIGMKKKEIEKKIDSIIEFSGLSDFIDTPVKKYSSGMYVRLGFSISAHMDPEILLLDEVLAVGDFSFQGKCVQKIQEMRTSGVAIIFISHSLEVVRRLCPQTIFLKNGRVVFNGDSAKAIDIYMDSVREKNKSENYSHPDNDSAAVNIENMIFCDFSGEESQEFATGGCMKIEIIYFAKRKICRPTFTVAFISGDQHLADHNSRFEGNDVEYISGHGKVTLLIENLLLLPGFYEARGHIADKDSIINYDIKSAYFLVKEQKRGSGVYYQPHCWNMNSGVII